MDAPPPAAPGLEPRGRGRAEERALLDLGGAAGPARGDGDGRHPLRHQVVEVRHRLEGRVRGHAARGDRAVGRVRGGLVRRRLHHQPPARRRDRRQGLDRLRVRRRAARPRARRPGPPAGAAPVLLEEREVGARPQRDGRGRAGLLGELRLPQLRRPVEGTAVLGGLGARLRLPWREATIRAIRAETPSAKTLVLDVPGWPGHAAGQHVDIRLTAEDGYQAQRSYSIASAPGRSEVELTVETIDDGEVSPYLTEEAHPGDGFELRGPIGGYFVWDPARDEPLLLVGGGSGLAPLVAMLRHRRATGPAVDARVLLSARTLED